MNQTSITWNESLIQRYNISGPRYTSYPTAVQFLNDENQKNKLLALENSKKENKPISIYVHLPFCAHVCYYCACNKVITKDRSRSSSYINHLIKEIKIISNLIGPTQQVEQLHFGGGTPTFLNHSELRQLMDALRNNFNLLNDDSGDYSIEIDPREADWATMGLLREIGFNRISLGVQDLDTTVQQAVNRLQSQEETQSIIDAARTLQFHSINVDLIYGLPFQTPNSFKKTVDEVVKLQPDRLSVFNYAHLPERFMPQRRINIADLPTAQQKLEMLHLTIQTLTNAGYKYIGMDHFALRDDELSIAQEEGVLHRNFQGYTTHSHCDLVGLGVSAISQIGNSFFQNKTDIKDYQSILEANLLPVSKQLTCTNEDNLRKFIIQKIICQFELSFIEVERIFNINFKKHFSELFPKLGTLAEDGIIKLEDESIAVTATGRLLVRTVCMLFDQYIEKTSKNTYSKVL